jgi:hypothetical protein
MNGKLRKRSWKVAFLPLLVFFTAIETEAFVIRRTYENCTPTRLLIFSDFYKSETPHDKTSKPEVRRRHRQARRKSVERRPRFYWSDPANLRNELCQFWKNCGVETDHPTIPSEVLLMHYERHDLRAAIAKNGGRESVSELLGGVPIMPGRWNDAVAHSSELQQLLQVDGSLSTERPPRVITSSAVEPTTSDKHWSHHDGRNPKGYWSLQTVIQEL